MSKAIKRTLTSRISDIEQENLTLNAEERLETLERFMRAVRDGRLIVLPSRRYEALERKLKLVYQPSKEGKYIKK